MLGDGQCQGIWERVTVTVGGHDAGRVVERSGAGVCHLGLDRGRGIDDPKGAAGHPREVALFHGQDHVLDRPHLDLVRVGRQVREPGQVLDHLWGRKEIDLRVDLMNLGVREIDPARVDHLHGVDDVVETPGRVDVTRVQQRLEFGDGQRRGRGRLHRDRTGQDALISVIERQRDVGARVADGVAAHDRHCTRVQGLHLGDREGQGVAVARLHRVRAGDDAQGGPVVRDRVLDIGRSIDDPVRGRQGGIAVDELAVLGHGQGQRVWR